MSAVLDAGRDESCGGEADMPRRAPDPVAESGFSYLALSSLLRFVGAGVLLGSLSIFLFQGWHGGDDIHRFGLLVAFTTALAGAGFASSRFIGENKGARLFLGIALFAVVVTFAVAGSLAYSGLGFSAPAAAYPTFVHWEAGTRSLGLFAAAGALVALSPVAWLGYRVLARRSATHLTKLFLIANGALLVPVRDAEMVAAGIAALAVLLIPQVVAAARTNPALATMEGRIARALIFAPLFVIVGRSLLLYSATALLLTTIAGLVFLALREMSLELPRRSKLRQVLEGFSPLPAVATALGLSRFIADSALASDSLALPAFSLVLAGMLVELSLRSASDNPRLRRAASLIVALGMSVNLLIHPSIAVAMLCMGGGLLVVVYGYTVQQKTVLGAGLVTMLAGLAYQLWMAASLFAIGDWSSLALLGAGTIVLASLLERHGLGIRRKVGLWHDRISGWEA